MNRLTILLVFLVSFAFIGAGCSQADPASAAIENYIKAMVDNEPITAINVSCSAWEQKASAEGSAFEGVAVEFDEPACQVIEENGTEATVVCDSTIRFSYDGGETQEIDLSDRQYIALFENGDWKMCGYK